MSPPPGDRRTLESQEVVERRGVFYEPAPLLRREESWRVDPWRPPLLPPAAPRRVHHSRSHRRAPAASAPTPAATPSPYSRPGAWDTIVIAGVLFLGLASVEGEVSSGVEVKKHKGHNGGRVTDHGTPASELTITFRTWDDETWASWEQVRAAINPQRPAEQRGPVDVAHPQFAQWDIHRVYVKSITLAKRDGNEWQFTAKVIQWLPPSSDRRGRSVTRSPTTPGGVDDAPTAFSLGDADADTADDPADTDSEP